MSQTALMDLLTFSMLTALILFMVSLTLKSFLKLSTLILRSFLDRIICFSQASPSVRTQLKAEMV